MSGEIYEVLNTRTGEVLVHHGKMADGIVSRALGLLGRHTLDPDEALIIRPCWSIHTLFMRFKIDVLFLGKDRAVRKVIHQMPTYRFAASRGAQETIELASGVLQHHNIRIGDQIEIRLANVDPAVG